MNLHEITIFWGSFQSIKIHLAQQVKQRGKPKGKAKK
jgi:hypothetical protein